MYIRWAEDWSDKDTAPAYKHISLGREVNSYLTLLAEHRTRLNYTAHPGLRQGTAQDQWLVRNVLGVDAHIGKNFRAFGEINNSFLFGDNPGNRSAQQENDAVVQQLFVAASGSGDSASYVVRLGRQEFMDGPPNIIHIRPAPDVYTSMDGLSLGMHWRRFRFNVFDFKTIELTNGGLGDSSRDGDSFRGVTMSFAAIRPIAPGGDALYIDPFAWDLHRDDQRWGPKVADEQRRIYGARMWGTQGKSQFDASLIRQDGSFGSRQIDAWGFFSNASWALPGAWKPRVGFHADYTSGGGAYTTGKMENFSFFYGSIPYFSWGNLIGPTNLTAFAPTLRMSPSQKVSAGLEYEVLRRSNEEDAVYTFLEGVYAGTQNVPGHDVGKMVRADVQWQVNPHLQTAIKAEYLDAGGVLKQAGYSNTFFVAIEAQVRF
jgi:hypothetical protein